MSRRIPGQFVPADVNTANDPAIMAAGPMAELIYRRANEYVKKNHRDGVVYSLDLPIIGNAIPNATKHAARLVCVGLWDATPDGWAIHSWLKWNLSLIEQAEQKARNAEGALLTNHKLDRHKKARKGCPLCEQEAK
ncbi:MAG: hypothetical protein ACOH10_07890 [Rhodoglobus sp.]